MVSERLRMGLGINDLVVHKELPRSLAEQIVLQELVREHDAPEAAG
jgi:hypothetical protein